MTTSRGQQIVLAARPKGKPELTDFRLEDTAIPTPAAVQFLLEVQYLSLDPYMRGGMNEGKSYATPLEIGEVMTGESVAHVLVSNNSAYAKGEVVLARTGWRTHALSDGAGLRKLDQAAAPVTTGLGVLGMPGFTAYGGQRVIGKPRPGETVVVAAASGPVGSLVGQLAQLAGARSIIAPPIFRRDSRRPVQTASMFTSRTSAAPSGKPSFRCSTSLHAFRSRGSWPSTTACQTATAPTDYP
jgi:NADPH-dependent curcumin reductase CurA